MPDHLLQAISTLGDVSLDKFNSTFDALLSSRISDQENDLHNIRRRVIRFLDSLGHCEFDFEGRRVYACPPAFVTLPVSGLPKVVLTGARTPRMIKNIKDFTKNNKDSISFSNMRQTSSQNLLPSAIFVEAIDYDHIQKMSHASHVGCYLTEPASLSLTKFSLGLKDITENLHYKRRSDLNWYKRTFSTDSLTFSKIQNIKDDFALVTYTNPVNQRRLHLIWDGEHATEIDRDIGRYVILAEKGVNVLLYDERRQLLAVPSTVPLPRFLGRATALCSGLAPEPAYLGKKTVGRIPAGHPVDIYYSVPSLIAKLISKKLSQSLIPYNISSDDKGVIA